MLKLLLAPNQGCYFSIVKVPLDVPQARMYFFGLLIWPRVIFFAILVPSRSCQGSHKLKY